MKWKWLCLALSFIGFIGYILQFIYILSPDLLVLAPVNIEPKKKRTQMNEKKWSVLNIHSHPSWQKSFSMLFACVYTMFLLSSVNFLLATHCLDELFFFPSSIWLLTLDRSSTLHNRWNNCRTRERQTKKKKKKKKKNEPKREIITMHDCLSI